MSSKVTYYMIPYRNSTGQEILLRNLTIGELSPEDNEQVSLGFGISDLRTYLTSNILNKINLAIEQGHLELDLAGVT